jgi:SAM-dependent methyltransferase
VDVVVSLQAAQRMHDNGLDWKQSIQEAARVLKPGGRFLFVESSTVNGESYLDYLIGLSENGGVEIKGGLEGLDATENEGSGGDNDEAADGDIETSKRSPLFDEVGYDQVDMVLQPHIAGVAIKASDADLTVAEKAQKRAQEESDRMAELSFDVFERGLKKRKRKKKKAGADEDGEEKK